VVLSPGPLAAEENSQTPALLAVRVPYPVDVVGAVPRKAARPTPPKAPGVRVLEVLAPEDHGQEMPRVTVGENRLIRLQYPVDPYHQQGCLEQMPDRESLGAPSLLLALRPPHRRIPHRDRARRPRRRAWG